jgi:phytoene dehydrogenase-like protein
VIRPTRFVRGGSGKLAEALANVVRGKGSEVRTNAGVRKIVVKDERAVGVVLESGEELAAARIASSADPTTTFLELVGPYEFDAEFVRAVRTIKYRGASAKLNLALDALPSFKGVDASLLRGTIALNPTIEGLERAYDDAKYGSYSQEPYIELTIPTLADPSQAPAGKHVLSAWVQYAPVRLKTKDWRLEAESFRSLVMGTLEEYAPDLESLVFSHQVLTPCDLQEIYHLREGSLTQGAVMLDQFLFMRPVAGWAQYRTPIANLYLCGGGAHPGGGVAGAAGRNAAREMLRVK